MTTPHAGTAMKLLHADTGLSIAVMFVTEVLLYVVCDAATPGSKPKRRSRLAGAVTECQSVPHHVLWQKLDLHPTAPHRRLRPTSAVALNDDASLPVADQPELEPEVGVPLRRRRSQPAAAVAGVVSQSRRSELAYRRLVRSIDGDHQRHHDSTNSTRLLDRSRRRLRRLRRRLRRQPAVGPAAHQCHLERFWKRMSRGVFPPYVETGRCTQSTCMFGLYECTRRRYAVKVLRRVPRRCNPLPSISVNSTYEQVWRFAEYHVTVGCECARKRRPGRVDFSATTTTRSPASGDD